MNILSLVGLLLERLALLAVAVGVPAVLARLVLVAVVVAAVVVVGRKLLLPGSKAKRSPYLLHFRLLAVLKIV